LEEGEQPTEDIVEYILSPPTKQEVGSSNYSDDSMVIFCIDISGSMGTTMTVSGKLDFPAPIMGKIKNNNVSRLHCIQAAVHRQLEQMKEQMPNCRPLVITFGSSVDVYGDGNVGRVSHDGSSMVEVDHVFMMGQKYGGTVNPARQSADRLINLVDNIVETGMTALGPAVVFALGVAAGSPGSKLMICTDGQANVGLGVVGGKSESEKKYIGATYEKIAAIAKTHSITVNVLSIRGDDCCLEFLGILADKTAGVVDIVNPIDLSKVVTNVMSKSILGTGVTCTLISKNKFAFIDSGTNKSVNEIGNVTSDTDLTFLYKSKVPILPGKHAKFQVRLSYSRPDGAQVLRVIAKSLPITDDREKMEEKINTGLVSMAAVQRSATLAQKGDYKSARINLISTMRLLQRGMKTRQQQREYINFIIQSEKLDGFMRQVQAQEAVFGSGVTTAVRDDSAAKNIVQMKQAHYGLFCAQ